MITRNRIILFIIVCLILWKILALLPALDQENNLPSILDNESATVEAIKPLHVDVYYETLCPDSRSFFIRQLLPTFEKAPHLFDISLVPYGKASTQKEVSGKLLFKCQHGPVECYGNKVHACAVHYVTSPSLLLRYTTCMISDNSDPEQAGSKCANNLNIEWAPILQCAHTAEGDELLAQHGEATHSLDPPASFIPTVQVNKRLDEQPALLKDLFLELCTRFKVAPPECA